MPYALCSMLDYDYDNDSDGERYMIYMAYMVEQAP